VFPVRYELNSSLCYLEEIRSFKVGSLAPVDAGSNTLAVAPRVVGEEKGTQCLGV
jgi:hypothetical protein